MLSTEKTTKKRWKDDFKSNGNRNPEKKEGEKGD